LSIFDERHHHPITSLGIPMPDRFGNHYVLLPLPSFDDLIDLEPEAKR